MSGGQLGVGEVGFSCILDIARRHGEQTDDRTVLLVRVKSARQVELQS